MQGNYYMQCINDIKLISMEIKTIYKQHIPTFTCLKLLQTLQSGPRPSRTTLISMSAP